MACGVVQPLGFQTPLCHYPKRVPQCKMVLQLQQRLFNEFVAQQSSQLLQVPTTSWKALFWYGWCGLKVPYGSVSGDRRCFLASCNRPCCTFERLHSECPPMRDRSLRPAISASTYLRRLWCSKNCRGIVPIVRHDADSA